MGSADCCRLTPFPIPDSPFPSYLITPSSDFAPVPFPMSSCGKTSLSLPEAERPVNFPQPPGASFVSHHSRLPPPAPNFTCFVVNVPPFVVSFSAALTVAPSRSEEHTSELQSRGLI